MGPFGWQKMEIAGICTAIINSDKIPYEVKSRRFIKALQSAKFNGNTTASPPVTDW
jgi:hypothetical protein